MNKKAINKTILFIKETFRANAHYTFNDWTIMYNHSITTMDYALLLSKRTGADKTVIAIAALLHDIGKTAKADEQTLLEKHEELGREVSKHFLKTLSIAKDQKKHIEDLFQINHPSIEKKLVKDGDYIAFYKDDILHSAFKQWADENHLPEQIQRKIKRFEYLSPKAQKLAKRYFERMKKAWSLPSTKENL